MSELSLDLSNTVYRFITKLETIITESKLAKAFKDLEKRRAEYYAMKSTYNTLNKMTDAELRDIGLCRGNIYEVAFNKSE